MPKDPLAWFKLNRAAPEGRHELLTVAPGLEKSPAILRVFPSEAERKRLNEVKVQVAQGPGYAYVDDDDGTLVWSRDYLATGEKLSIYLDFIHELCHVRQFREGKDLYDKRYSYVDRPTEIEAYQVAVEEARRLGLDDAWLFEYLHVEWVTAKEHARLAKACGVQAPKKPA
jgi:hypothetical protein